MKKMISVSLAAILSLALTACGTGGVQETSSQGGASTAPQEAKKDEKWPTKPINMIISYAPGGSTDVTARILMPYVEKELGVPINVINKPGGSGWIGWTELAKANPDGYTLGYVNTPNIMTGYMDPKQNRKENLDSFSFIANHIVNPGIIGIRKDETRFTDIKSLIEYAKNNELTATASGVGSDEHYAALNMNKTFGTKFRVVQNKGSAEAPVQVMGGHVDVLLANVGDAYTLHQSGEIKIVAVTTEERSPFLPDIATLKENGLEGVIFMSAAGVAAPKGVDPEKLEILRAAIEKGMKNEEQIKKQADAGLQMDYKDGQDYMNMLKADEELVNSLRDMMGW